MFSLYLLARSDTAANGKALPFVVLHSVLSKQEHENLTISWLISHHINMVRAIQVEPDCGGERLE